MAEDAALTRFANSQIHQNVAETNVAINLRFAVGKRVGVASSGRTDDEGIRRLAANAAAIARVVEELEDWGGLPEPTPIEEVTAGYARGHRRSLAGTARRRRPGGHRRGRCGRGDRLRLVLDGHGDHGGGQFEGRSRGRDADRGPAADRVHGAERRHGVRGAVRGRRHDHRRGRDRPGSVGQGARDRERGRHRCRRLPRRPRGIRRRGPARHARLPRVLGPRRPGRAQLRGDRQAHRQRSRLGRGRRARSRPACRWVSTTRAWPSNG